MATFAIGDIHGCYRTLRKLLRTCGYRQGIDTLWLVGDLINRGPRSLDVLRWASDQGHRLITVLGNHDLHLIGCKLGVREPSKRDTIAPLLANDSISEEFEWLRSRPLCYHHDAYVLVHAGLLPQWNIATAMHLAQDLERLLRHAEHAPGLLRKWKTSAADSWPADSRPDDTEVSQRRLVALNALTRMRICTPEGRMNLSFTGSPDDTPSPFSPWFDLRADTDEAPTIICGHWSALGLRITRKLIALDSGCLWGRTLTAVRLEDRRVYQQQHCD